jgi:quercetin dioxygenase-like cupin family protein
MPVDPNVQAGMRDRMAKASGQAVRFPDRVRLPLAFDVPAMQAELAALQGADWVEHFVKQNYSGDWSVMPLRAPKGETHPIRMVYSDPSATDWVDTPWLDRSPSLRQAVATFRCPVTSVRLMRLAAGSRIHEHHDHDLMAEAGVARIHVPITTNPGVTFVLNGTAVAMVPGEAWYLRLADPHAVRNEGASDRVHLVLDVVVDAWLERMLEG